MCKRLIIGLLAAVGLQALAVDADFSGEYRLRTNTGDFSTDDLNVGNIGQNLAKEIKTRSKVSFSLSPSEALEAKVTTYLNFTEGGMGDTAYLGHADWMISDDLVLRAGRTVYQIAQGQVLGANDYEDLPTMHNGVFVMHSSEALGFDLALLQHVDGTMASGEDAKKASPSLVVSLNMHSFPELAKKVNIHAIVPSVDNFTGSVRLGATLMGGMTGVGYSVTAASSSIMEGGEGSKMVDGAMVDGKLGYTYEWDSSKIKGFIGVHWEGGNYDALHYNKHWYAGKLDKATWGKGQNYYLGGLSYMINSDNKTGVKGYYFAKDAGGVKKGDIEVDVFYKASLASAVALKVWAGVSKSSEKDALSGKAEAALSMKF